MNYNPMNEKEELKEIAQDLTKESLLTLQMSEKTNLILQTINLKFMI